MAPLTLGAPAASAQYLVVLIKALYPRCGARWMYVRSAAAGFAGFLAATYFLEGVGMAVLDSGDTADSAVDIGYCILDVSRTLYSCMYAYMVYRTAKMDTEACGKLEIQREVSAHLDAMQVLDTRPASTPMPIDLDFAASARLVSNSTPGQWKRQIAHLFADPSLSIVKTTEIALGDGMGAGWWGTSRRGVWRGNAVVLKALHALNGPMCVRAGW